MKPSINRLFVGLILGAVVIAPVSCAPAPTPPPQRIGGGEASWAFGFDNLADLCAYSDIIVVGTVDRSIITEHEGGRLFLTKSWGAK